MTWVHSGLGSLGIIGAIAWMSLIVLMAGGWGPPGSAEYDRYEANSQLWVFALALMACGFIGLFLKYRTGAAPALGLSATVPVLVGFVLMVAGNVAEFRFFSHLPYEAGNARMWAWNCSSSGSCQSSWDPCSLECRRGARRFFPCGPNGCSCWHFPPHLWLPPRRCIPFRRALRRSSPHTGRAAEVPAA